MKILAAGDIHSDKELVEKLADKAEKENVDLVILAGDLGLAGAQMDGMIGPFVKRKKQVFVIPGNHESNACVSSLAELYGIRNIHGKYEIIGNVGFFGAGGANTGPFSTSESEIYSMLKKGFEGVKNIEKKVMITHVHPRNSLMENFSSLVRGSESVRGAIESLKPDLLICAHVHEAEGIEELIGKTKVINVSRSGKIIDI